MITYNGILFYYGSKAITALSIYLAVGLSTTKNTLSIETWKVRVIFLLKSKWQIRRKLCELNDVTVTSAHGNI